MAIYKTVMVLSLVMLFGGMLGIFILPEIIKVAIRSQVSLKNGTDVREFYIKLPFPLDFRIYFFNVTNPKEVQQGGKPILKEVGPYCYDTIIQRKVGLLILISLNFLKFKVGANHDALKIIKDLKNNEIREISLLPILLIAGLGRIVKFLLQRRVFREWKERIKITESDVDDSFTYTPFDHFYFNSDRSLPNSDEDYVTILNPFIVGMVNAVAQDYPAFLKTLNKAIKAIYTDQDSIFLTAKVKDILFDGVRTDCNREDFAAKAVCSQMKAQVKGLKEPEENIFFISVLGDRNATEKKRVKVLRGIKKNKFLGKLIEYDGKKELDIWSSAKCNKFNGTDGWIFPPLTDKEAGIKSFSPDLCRNIRAQYSESTVLKGMDVNVFRVSLGDQSTDPEEKCYCPSPRTCLKKGVFDLSKCNGIPIYATLPHFYDTDESLLQDVDGLTPNEESHATIIYFQQMLGLPLSASLRMQFNLKIANNSKISLMENLTTSEILHPIFWLQESAEIEGDLLKKVKFILLLIKVSTIMNYAGLATSFLGLFAAGYLYQKRGTSVDINTSPTNSAISSASMSKAASEIEFIPSNPLNTQNRNITRLTPAIKRGIDNRTFVTD